MMERKDPYTIYRVKVAEYDPRTELEGYSYYDFDDNMIAYRFRELVFKAKNVTAVYLPQPITF